MRIQKNKGRIVVSLDIVKTKKNHGFYVVQLKGTFQSVEQKELSLYITIIGDILVCLTYDEFTGNTTLRTFGSLVTPGCS